MRLAGAKTVCFVAPVPRLEKRTRLKKFSARYRDELFEVDLVGWEREGSERSLPMDEGLRHLELAHRGGGYATGSLGRHYLSWIIKSAVRLVRTRPRIVHALGLEGALASLPLRIIAPRTILIYDDADRFSLCHDFGSRPTQLIQAIERAVCRLCTVHIIPGETRYPDGLPCSATIIIKNTPSEDVVMEALEEPITKPRLLRILVTGWLGEQRGVAVIDEIVGHLSNDQRFEFVVAGRITGAKAQAFVNREGVRYVGEVSNVEAVRLAAESFLVFTLYDPAIPINRYAEPNKWGDCARVQVPFIVNYEVVTARPYLDKGAAIGFPYQDSEQGSAEIRALANDRNRYRNMQHAIGCMATASFDYSVTHSLLPLLEPTDSANRG